MSVFAVLHNGNFEHLTCGCTVNVTAVFKDLLPPFLTGKPGNDSRFDSGEVGYDKLPAVLRNEGGTHKFGQHIRHGVIFAGNGKVAVVAYHISCVCKIFHMVLGQVLKLHETSGISPGSVGSVKLKHSANPVIGTHGIFHGGVFTNRRLGKLLTNQKHFTKFLRAVL